MQVSSTPPFAVRGIDHLAVGTADMAESLHFYVKVLGFELIMARKSHPAADEDHPLVSDDDPDKEKAAFRRPPGAPQYDSIRHYCLDMGNDTVFSLFEYPPEAPQAVRDSVAGLQHIAFHAERPEFDKVRSRLDEFGIEYLGPLYLGDGHTSINLFDPSGLRLEIVTAGDGPSYQSVDRARMPEDLVREELRTLYKTEVEIDDILARS
ncbi:VOC family protein [Symbioplanes lichenis]|uniref:VOC family protein n=1 Tax=Symbioplanes lichenis TaxID=1629072 RepID=UPI0027396A52|nr:VOC family protein [Actinoplanes lichenis]